MAALSVTLTSHGDGGPPPAAVAVPQFPAGTPAALQDRLRESFNDDWFHYGGPVPTPFAIYDNNGTGWPGGFGRGVSGSVGDRRGGKDLPKFWSELDLRGYRIMSRWLWDTNPFMLGFGRALTDYHIGKGWQWQACLRGQKKQAYATASAAGEAKSPDAMLTERAQNLLDAWRDRVGWPLRSREGFRRLHRDGEVIQRFARGGRGELPEHRFVNPEQIGSPVGAADGPDSYGIRRGRGNGADEGGPVLAVYVRDHDGDGSEGRWENADPSDPTARVLFHKTNTDSDVKRGLPDSFSLTDPLNEAVKVVKNMVVVAAAQAAVAWREKFPTGTPSQVGALIPTGQPDPRTPYTANGQTIYSDRIAAGTVLRTEGNREFEAGPTQVGVPNYVEACQAALRMACVRWGLPPYLTAKADDINFASSLTAGSPFAVAIEGGQIEWGAIERATALKVLDLACESGLLTPEERARLDVECIAPTVASADPGAETQRNKVLFDAKVLDPYTWMQREGLDPSHVEANWKAWQARNPQPQPAPGAVPPQEGGQPGKSAPATESVTESTDASGHAHKGSGPGGGQFTAGNGGGEKADDDEDDPHEETHAAWQEEDDAEAEKRDAEDDSDIEARDAEDAAHDNALNEASDAIAAKREKEDAAREKARERQDRDTERDRAKANREWEKVKAERVKRDRDVVRDRVKADRETKAARKAEDATREAAQQAERDALEKQMAEERAAADPDDDEGRDEWEDEQRENLQDEHDQADQDVADARDEEDAAAEAAREKEDEEEDARREVEDAKRDEEEQAWDAEDEALTDARDTEDAELEAARDAEDADLQGRYDRGAADRKAARDQAEADRQARWDAADAATYHARKKQNPAAHAAYHDAATHAKYSAAG